MIKSAILCFAVISASFPNFVIGLDSKAVKEMRCIAPPSTGEVGIDLKWFGSVDKFYLPMWSKLYAHRTASDLLERCPSLISELELGPSSCLLMKKGNLVYGFGREIKYNMSGDTSSITFKAPWSGAKTGKYAFHLTDNENFVLGVTCWDDNESSWAVLSTKSYLEPEVRSKILFYIKGLGFKEENVVDENYSSCSLYSQMPFMTYPYFMNPYFLSFNFNPMLPLGYHKKY